MGHVLKHFFSVSDLMEAIFVYTLLGQILEQTRSVWFLVLSICIGLVKSIKKINKWDFLKIINLYRMAGMNKTMLTVSNDKNLKLNFTKNGGLIYKGRIFSKVINTMKLILHLVPFICSQLKNWWHHLWTRFFFQKSYCLDYEIEYCDKEQKIPKDLKLRAVIHDEDLYDQVRIF